jgi:hypothetical protein
MPTFQMNLIQARTFFLHRDGLCGRNDRRKGTGARELRALRINPERLLDIKGVVCDQHGELLCVPMGIPFPMAVRGADASDESCPCWIQEIALPKLRPSIIRVIITFPLLFPQRVAGNHARHQLQCIATSSEGLSVELPVSYTV